MVAKVSEAQDISTASALAWRAWRLVWEWPVPVASAIVLVVVLLAGPWWLTALVALAVAAVIRRMWSWTVQWGRLGRDQRSWHGALGVPGEAAASGMTALGGEPARLVARAETNAAVELTFRLVPGIDRKKVFGALPHIATWQHGVRAAVHDAATARIGRPDRIVVRVSKRDALADGRTAGWVDDGPDGWKK